MRGANDTTNAHERTQARIHTHGASYPTYPCQRRGSRCSRPSPSIAKEAATTTAITAAPEVYPKSSFCSRLRTRPRTRPRSRLGRPHRCRSRRRTRPAAGSFIFQLCVASTLCTPYHGP
eukprot:scaffold22233_cov55-Phaeocystis_antarctica.AAC.2